MKLARTFFSGALLCLVGGSAQLPWEFHTDSFMEENDLWKEDRTFEKENMTQAEFDTIIDNA
jgi:hypothetical protein